MREFEINKNPNGCGNLFSKNKISFQPGLTVLVGCNGSGKTTLLNCLKDQLRKEKILRLYYDNLYDGGVNARREAGYRGDFEFYATSTCSSEGENIVLNLGNIAKSVGSLIRKFPNEKELWLLLDAVDSGLSIDNIQDLKEHLFDFIIKQNLDKEIYIIVSANEYEMCKNEKCFDVYKCDYITFTSYAEYSDFILKSRKRKEKRDEKYIEKHNKSHTSPF
jgi:predicted ATP-dependent endonuclease of OLD family